MIATEDTVARQKSPGDFALNWFFCDLTYLTVSPERVRCADVDDVLGGIARGFRLLGEHPVRDAYDPDALLIMNLGLLSGTQFMTGLRTYFHAYSPLKRSATGMPSAMWTAGSGKFGTKLRFLGVEEVIFTGRCPGPALLHISHGDDGRPQFHFEDASALVGKRVNDKMQTLHKKYPDAHFAVIGPAGEHYEQVRYAAIALSTENQLKSGDPKSRFCGRGGIGGVLGSKNLLAIVADTKDGKAAVADNFKEINNLVARGDGSRRFREAKTGGLGGTWANYLAFNPHHAMPEMNFTPTGTDISVPLYRENVEETGAYVIKDEACYRCGIRCHKNVYDADEKGKAGKFRAKLDFEPLNLMSSNIGLFDVDKACDLVELIDELGMDSISCGVTLSYAMEYNRRHAELGDGKMIVDGVAYGDFETARRVVEAVGVGELAELGQGTLRLSEQTGETEYAMHCKGVEFPAYLPQINPGYPWALAGGHMSMRTYFIVLNERETNLEPWVEAITSARRGISIIRDDVIGICKFAGLTNDKIVEAINALSGLSLDEEQLEAVVLRAFLRGYALEKRQGFTSADYVMPAQAHQEHPQIDLPYFNTPEFFGQLRDRVLAKFDAMLQEQGLE